MISSSVKNNTENIKDLNDDKLKGFNDGYYTSAYIVTKNGNVYDSTGWRPEPGDDLRTRDYYKGAVKNEGIFLSDVYVDADTKQFVITISNPLYSKNNEFLGVISIDILLDYISEFIEQNELFDGAGRILLLTHNEDIMYYSNKDYVTKNVKDVEYINKLLPEYKENANKISLIEDMNGDKYKSYTKLLATTNWLLTIDLNESVIKNSIFNLLKTELLLTLIVLILGLASAIAISNKIKVSISDMKEYIRELSKYNLSFKPSDKNLNRRDEIGDIYRDLKILNDNFKILINHIAEDMENLNKYSEDVHYLSENISEASEAIAKDIESLSSSAYDQAKEAEIGSNSIQKLGHIISANKKLIAKSMESNKVVNDNVEIGLHLISELVKTSQQSSEFSKKVYDVVKTTENNSKKISQASDLIADVADQTNLLALNAAIELAVGM